MKKLNILLIAGHGGSDPGAVGNGHKEADLTREVVSLLKPQLDNVANVTVFDTSKDPYTYFKSNSFNFKAYDYVFEVHFNSSVLSSANGTEILVHPTEKSTGVEGVVTENLARLGFRNRGVKTRSNLQNMNICKGKQGVSYALLEVCFISNASDVQLYVNKKSAVVKAIADGIKQGFDLSEEDTEAIKILKTKVGLADETIDFLKTYKYGKDLIEKLASAVK